MSDENLYDEFGNYIGPDLDTSSSDDSDADADSVAGFASQPLHHDEADSMDVDDNTNSMGLSAVDANSSIVLHEDKSHYPSATEVYGTGVFTATIDEDSQVLEEGIIKAIKTKNFSAVVQGTTKDGEVCRVEGV